MRYLKRKQIISKLKNYMSELGYDYFSLSEVQQSFLIDLCYSNPKLTNNLKAYIDIVTNTDGSFFVAADESILTKEQKQNLKALNKACCYTKYQVESFVQNIKETVKQEEQILDKGRELSAAIGDFLREYAQKLPDPDLVRKFQIEHWLETHNYS